METKHIQKGHWKTGERRLDDNTIPIHTDDKLSPLAYVSPRPLYDDTQESNARLIAAAPELLEACKMAIAAFPWASDYSDPTCKEANAIRAIQKAISEAEGRDGQ